MKYFAIIVGGGSGSRMNNELPKQFMLLNGRPLLFYTIEAFYHSVHSPKIILVLSADHINFWKELCVTHKFHNAHTIVAGGSERFYSVKNGLNAVLEDGLVAVHDAVRPAVSAELIKNTFNAAADKGNAVPAIRPSETVRYHGKIISREEVMLLQTPQVFDAKILKAAYENPFQPEFTDDAAVAEAIGMTINLIEGERANLKVTWPADLLIAEVFLNKKASQI